MKLNSQGIVIMKGLVQYSQNWTFCHWNGRKVTISKYVYFPNTKIEN